MKVSVVIPTLGREKELIETVKGLLAQTRVPDEIVIVDQNEPELKTVTEFLRQVNVVRELVKHVRGVPPGVVPNYNRCLKEATGDIVIFVDDDVVPSVELIEAHLKNYTRPGSEKLGGVAGRITNPAKKETRTEHVASYSPWTGHMVAHFDSVRKASAQFAQGANMSFRREALESVGGFDPKFDGNGYYFETDLGLRLKERGWKMIFDPEATLVHLMAAAGGARIKDKSVHTYHFVKNGLKLFKRHGKRAALPLFVAKTAVYLALKSAYNLNPEILKKGARGIVEGLASDMT